MTEVLLTGRGLLESPRWHDGTLYVSDWSAGEVFTLDGTVVARVDSLPLCFDFLPDGRLVLVDSARGRLVDRDGTVLAELGAGNWNDITVDAHGNVYVNRVEFDGTPGAVHLVRDGRVRQVADGLAFPNGMAVLGDTLIVAESHGHRLTAFTIGADGTPADRRVWAEVADSAPDGICVDGDTVWYADVPNQCSVRVAEGGAVLDRVELDRGGFACAIGDGTLYTVAAEFQGMAGDLVAPGSGQVLATPLAGR